jgi:hypothetical protein
MMFMAIHLKKPMLSKTTDIIIVDRIVKEAPLTISKIFKTSLHGTIPEINTIAAPILVGIISLIPNGLHNMSMMVNKKIVVIIIS